MKTVYDLVVDSGNSSDGLGSYDTREAATFAGQDWVSNQSCYFLDSLTEKERAEINNICQRESIDSSPAAGSAWEPIEADLYASILDDYGFECTFEVYERAVPDDEIISDYIAAIVKKISVTNSLDDGAIFSTVKSSDLDEQPSVSVVVEKIVSGIRADLSGYFDTLMENPEEPFFTELEALLEGIADEDEFYKTNKPL